jgi:bifunctional DNA-binding transcriptional regulator/antitoxin component of YhaV-PrlF toxin-antitoxin module
MNKVKRKPGQTRISSKHQVTLPVRALQRAGLHHGDMIMVEVDGPGKLRLSRAVDPIEQFAGIFTGAFEDGYLDTLRHEWD